MELGMPETVRVAAEITGEGKVGFMGTGVNIGGSTSLTILFRKKPGHRMTPVMAMGLGWRNVR